MVQDYHLGKQAVEWIMPQVSQRYNQTLKEVAQLSVWWIIILYKSDLKIAKELNSILKV